MASVFLSYDRDDAKRARPIALALEKAGHCVWWDQHIGGGTQYAKEIEAALNSADVVVVLWSPTAVESAWVRDEAGAGRDKGRLIPLALEGTPPPLGFRQFQSIDLGRWQGRGKVPRLAELLTAIDRQARAASISAPRDPTAARRPRAGPSLNHWAGIAVAVGIFFVIVGLVIGHPWDRTRATALPIVGTAAGDNSPASKALVEAIHAELSSAAESGSAKWQVLDPSTGQQQPDLLIRAIDSSSDSGSKASITLVDRNGRSALWSRKFDLSRQRPSDFRQQVSMTARRALDCAAEGREGRISREALKLYLSGCPQLAEAGTDDISGVIETLEAVVKNAPGFKAGWAKLLLAASYDGPDLQDPASANRKILQGYIDQARRIDPKMPEIAIAQAQLLPRRAYGEALRLLDAAHARSPEDADVLVYRTDALARVGRVSDAIDDARQAALLDPGSPMALSSYALTLAFSGRTQAAREQLERADRLWAGTGIVHDLDDEFRLRFGDPKDLVNTEVFRLAPPAWQMYVRTRIDPTPANVDRFVAMLRQLHARRGVHAGDVAGHAQAYGELHRENELYEMIAQVAPGEDISLFSDVAFRPSLRKFRQDPRFMVIAKRIGLVDYWQTSGKWPDFCFTDPDQPYDCKKEAAKLKA